MKFRILIRHDRQLESNRALRVWIENHSLLIENRKWFIDSIYRAVGLDFRSIE